MAVAYESWRAKVHVEHPSKTSTTTTACFINNRNGESKYCCRVLKKRDKKKLAVKCKCKDNVLLESTSSPSEKNSAICGRFKAMGEDCCKCIVALYEYLAEYVKCLAALVCLRKRHSLFCCRLCNLLRATSVVWKDGCDMLRSVIDCLLGIQ